RRVVADADPDHPLHPDEPDPLPSELGELAADRDHRGHHGPRCLVAVFAPRAGLRLHPVAAALLAPPRSDVARIRPADPGGEELALSEGLGFGIAPTFFLIAARMWNARRRPATWVIKVSRGAAS